MPSRRIKSTAINERISEAQKGKTHLACRVCRSRRIKCDGQKGACGRCRQDKRSDCSYENVGSAERMAGRQRKRALRKQHVSDDDNASVSNEKGGHDESVDGHQDWTSPLLNSAQPLILTSPQQQAQQLIQNFYNNTSTTPHLQPPSFTTAASSSIAAIKKNKPSNDSIQQRRVKLTPVSSSLSSSTTNLTDESSSAKYASSLLTSMQSSGSEEANALASGYPPATSWVMSPATVALDQQQPIPPAFDYQANSGIDPGSVDSLWKVYDWQHRCNSGMLPQHFSQPLPSSTAFTP